MELTGKAKEKAKEIYNKQFYCYKEQHSAGRCNINKPCEDCKVYN